MPRKVEEEILLGLSVQNHVIATGGSAIYSDQAMTYLKSDGILIFLDVDFATLESRILDFNCRGISKRPDQSFDELFEERFPLYAKHADIAIKCGSMTQEQVCERIIEEVKAKKFRMSPWEGIGGAMIGTAGIFTKISPAILF